MRCFMLQLQVASLLLGLAFAAACSSSPAQAPVSNPPAPATMHEPAAGTPANNGGAGSSSTAGAGSVAQAGAAAGSGAPRPAAPMAGSPSPSPATPDAGGPSDGCAKFDNTYDAIQKAVFENHGCTADSCHGSSAQGELDLRAGTSYAKLFQVRAQGSSLMRVQPSAPQESYLYLKLAAATRPGTVTIANSPMPIGAAPLDEGELEAVRLWILGGAPQLGSVGDPSAFGSTEEIAKRLNACLPKADPITVAPLEPPPAAEGLQFRSPQWALEGGAEREICVATYYDFTNVVPAEFKSADGTKFYTSSSRLRQDPGSHHYVLSNPSIERTYASDPAFGKWTCTAERDGQACDPLDPMSCGANGVCGSAIADTLACIAYGPVVLGSADLLTEGLIENVQAANQYLPPREGVYRELPIKGFLYHDLHGFNVTDKDAKLQARLNVYFAKDRRRRLEQAIDYQNVYLAAGTAPFTTKTVCADHVAPTGAEMVRLTSHMHKRGKRFWVTDPNGAMIYENFIYSDPLYKEFDPGITFGMSAASRTLKACATYNNGLTADGVPDPETVTRYSRLPDRTLCTPVACVAGKVAAACNGANDHATCDSAPGAGDGKCDACPITPGPTTEDEMFVVMPWYILPEGQ